MDGESVRAIVAALMWAGGTSTERKAKSPNTFLTVSDDLLKCSYQLGSPVASESVDVVLIDPTAFAALRFSEWLARQTEDVRQVYRDALTPPT